MQHIIVMGVSGSGKTSVGAGLAEALGLPFLEGDSLHPAENIAKMKAGIPLQDKDRWPWLARIGEHLSAAPHGIVISCSALKKTYRDHLRAAVYKHGSTRLLFIFLDGTFEVLHEHMRHRTGHFMPVSMLESQLATLEPPLDEPDVYHANVIYPVAEIVEQASNWARNH